MPKRLNKNVIKSFEVIENFLRFILVLKIHENEQIKPVN